MSISPEMSFLSDDVAIVASGALERIQDATTTLDVVDAGLSSVALVQALRRTDNHEDAELDRLLLTFQAAVETRLKAVKLPRES